MVRRHLLPPGKFETFQVISDNNNQQIDIASSRSPSRHIYVEPVISDNYNQQENSNYNQSDSMARIIPKSMTISQSHQSVSTNVKNSGVFSNTFFLLFVFESTYLTRAKKDAVCIQKLSFQLTTLICFSQLNAC